MLVRVDGQLFAPLKKRHPCQKAVEEMRFLIAALTKPGQVVLDCFCGLGSTLVAASPAQASSFGYVYLVTCPFLRKARRTYRPKWSMTSSCVGDRTSARCGPLGAGGGPTRQRPMQPPPNVTPPTQRSQIVQAARPSG
jgi:hypothetical protein